MSTFVGVAATAIGPLALSLSRSWVGGYQEAALVFVIIPIAVGLISLTVTEPDRR